MKAVQLPKKNRGPFLLALALDELNKGIFHGWVRVLGRGCLAFQLIRAAGRDDSPAEDQGDPIAVFSLIHEMGRHDHSDALFHQAGSNLLGCRRTGHPFDSYACLQTFQRGLFERNRTAGIEHEIQDHLVNLRAVGHHRRQGIVGDCSSAFLHRASQIRDSIRKDRLAVGRCKFRRPRTQACICQQVVNQTVHSRGAIHRDVRRGWIERRGAGNPVRAAAHPRGTCRPGGPEPGAPGRGVRVDGHSHAHGDAG